MNLTQKDIKGILNILRKEYSDSTTALTFETPFQLLISTILSAQSTDKQVNKITQSLYRKYPDARSFITLSQVDLESKIKSIGLYRSKARNILATCKILVERYQGKVPPDRVELVKLPGVGRKTANVVLSVGFNHDAIAVDTHVFRVSNRIGLARAATVEKTEEQLMKNIPQNDWSASHHWLIWHGRLICKAQNPRCSECPIKNFCHFFHQQTRTT
ncbi:MAG: endonuclease III [bacterium]|nr:MAG: endonuclease III [bacterium]